ncbi:type II toxin-antitoxin system RelE/ParE family toxin [Paraburkholderia sp. XV]|uniref:type II toxin-antitoxin system RelE/ParE family toxin n=1 Tax=Paraburkholderia sp. XV TaxID=2831520 RepID=UPI001CD31394|nr:type II toxin-antitoxin system RelE/ParE family toxin [Paraburkholderia sp. XV]
MKSKPVVPTRQAQQDLETEIDYYLFDESSEAAALGFIAAVEEASQKPGKNPDLDLHVTPNSTCPDSGHGHLSVPHLVFYVDRDDHVEIWRVINAVRVIPTWLLNQNG